MKAARMRSKVEKAMSAETEERMSERARKRLKEAQLRMPKRPLDERGKPIHPVLPPDLTRLNDLQLGRLHSEFAAVAQYALGALALIAVDSAEAKYQDKLVRAKVHMDKSGTVEDKKSKVELDKRTRASSFAARVGEGHESLTRAVLEGFIIGRDATSREMTRRQRAEFNRT